MLMRFIQSPDDGGKGGSGRGAADADLQEAIRDADQIHREKSGGAKPAKKDPPPDDGGDDENSITGTIKEMIEKGDVGDSTDLDGLEDETKRKPAAKGENKDDEGSQSTDEELKALREEFKSLGDEAPPGSQAIKEKFNRHKADLKKAIDNIVAERKEKVALAKELADLKAKAPQGDIKIEETEPYKALATKTKEQEELIDRISLADSPRFKEKYEKPIQLGQKKAVPYLMRIADPTKRAAIAGALDKLIAGTPPGAEHDPAFYDGMEALLSSDGVTDGMRRGLDPILVSIRESTNERAAALADWKATRKEFGAAEIQGVEENVKTARGAVAAVRAEFEKKNAAQIAKLKDNGDPYDYQKTVDTMLPAIQNELEKTVRTGLPTPFVLAMMNQGMEAEVLAKRHDRLIALAGDWFKENKELKKKLKELSGDEDTERGGRGGHTKKTDSEDEGEEYGMVAAVKAASANG